MTTPTIRVAGIDQLVCTDDTRELLQQIAAAAPHVPEAQAEIREFAAHVASRRREAQLDDALRAVSAAGDRSSQVFDTEIRLRLCVRTG